MLVSLGEENGFLGRKFILNYIDEYIRIMEAK
jgi:hypothetical protein